MSALPPKADTRPRDGMFALGHKETSELKDGESRAALAIYNFAHLLWRVAVHSSWQSECPFLGHERTRGLQQS